MSLLTNYPYITICVKQGILKAIINQLIDTFMSRLSTVPGVFNFADALAQEKKGKRLIPNSLVSKVIAEGIQDSSPGSKVWTRTIIAFPAPGLAFGYEVCFTNRPYSFVLDTSQFSKEKNVALVFDDFSIHRDGRRVEFIPRSIDVITDFPQESGWCGSSKNGIPQHNSKYDLYLWRWACEMIVPIVRFPASTGSFGPKDFFLNHRHSDRFGVLLSSDELVKDQVVPIRLVQSV